MERGTGLPPHIGEITGLPQEREETVTGISRERVETITEIPEEKKDLRRFMTGVEVRSNPATEEAEGLRRVRQGQQLLPLLKLHLLTQTKNPQHTQNGKFGRKTSEGLKSKCL